MFILKHHFLLASQLPERQALVLHYTCYSLCSGLQTTDGQRGAPQERLNINALSPLTTGGTPGNLIRRKKRRDVGDKDVGEILECEAGAVKRSHVSVLVIYFSKETIGR